MSEMTDTSALENLKYAHAIDVPLDLSSQEVHELWADIEARDKRVAELEALVQRLVEAGDKVAHYSNFEDFDINGIDEWDTLVAEYRASKDGGVE